MKAIMIIDGKKCLCKLSIMKVLDAGYNEVVPIINLTKYEKKVTKNSQEDVTENETR